ncbi:uncharacterized protein LOC131950253 isoform X2 [Physella acuta]|nr:uncharacterized protein LOC131950253 isoform X2 [Physella acuta]XP_059168311.1 uncharacterized protein LOC131950253 isoform X2 [Physella acuta]XP_059168312.1 uncharacterized protein LOC131950253 isoform X2 [Physella acuta]XP_059168313.1 uncharacterized protein LOC131950253 isoform X2 [Physella acuta]
MDGPSFYCAYLRFSPISKPPTNIGVLQAPIKELYFKYRKTPASGRSACLKLIQKGVLVVFYEDGNVKDEMFFDFSSVVFVEAVKFLPVKTSSEKKIKALFVPVDESKAQLSDKSAFLVEKPFQFLTSTTHPPLVVCVVRRPTGVKALDCHVFALDTVENSLHITALIGSTQIPPGIPVGRGDGGDPSKAKGNFDRGGRGDVIRTEYGEYSVYRGPHGYEGPPPGQRYSGGPLMSPVRNGPNPGVIPGGGIMLTQDNFRDPPSQNPAYGLYEQQNMGGVQLRNRPDVIMHVRQRSGDSGENSPHDKSFTSNAGSEQGAARLRMEEANLRNAQRLSGGLGMAGNRMSVGQLPSGEKISPHLHDARYLSGPQFSPRNSDPSLSPAVNSPRSPQVYSPTSPRGFDGGPIFSASNLESRVMDDDAGEPNPSGKPVAKVPPHMKAGIKVLPSDFFAVKLKPKAEKQTESSFDESGGYDNNKELMEKYKEIQEHQKDSGISSGARPTSGNIRGNQYDDGDGFREFSKHRYEENTRDYSSNWQDTSPDRPVPGDVYRHGAPGAPGYPRYEDNNNKNRYSVPDYGMDPHMGRQWNNGQKSQSSYEMGNPSPYPHNPGLDPHSRMKDLEIANMFSNFGLQGGRPAPDMHRQMRDRNEFAEGLGYLP